MQPNITANNLSLARRFNRIAGIIFGNNGKLSSSFINKINVHDCSLYARISGDVQCVHIENNRNHKKVTLPTITLLNVNVLLTTVTFYDRYCILLLNKCNYIAVFNRNTNKKAVLSQGNRAMPQLFFSV